MTIVLLATRSNFGLFSPLSLGVILIVPLISLGASPIVSGLTALPALAGLTWWEPAMRLSHVAAGLFVVGGLSIAWLPRFSPQRSGLAWFPILVLLIPLSIMSSLATGVFSAPSAFWVLWHHWGAYITPVEALVGGGVPFRDFPVQYGMGPTLIINALDRSDAWHGTYIAVTLTNLLYLLTLGGCVALLTRSVNRGLALLGLAATACTALFWTGYPPDFVGALVAPSVSGLRFLPLSALLFYILYFETMGGPNRAVGHMLWFLGIAWSPEAAFYSSLVWWSYLALGRAQQEHKPWRVLLVVLTGAVIALLALVIGLAALAVVFWLAFGEWPSLSGYLTYVLNPPGILKPNFKGPIWLILAAIACCFVAFPRMADREMRMGLPCACALIAVCSYYIGRSHDNNILNILPFASLVFVMVLACDAPALTSFSRTVLAGLLIWTITFGFDSWRLAFADANARRIGSAAMLADMRLSTPTAFSLVDRSLAFASPAAAPAADAGAALAWLRDMRAGQVLLVNPSYVQIRDMPGPIWTGMTNIANFGLLPPDVIQMFIRNGAEHFRRSGWILSDRAHAGPWLDYFRTAYNVSEERAFGGYTAYKMVPR